jgi:hypothetical protein
MNKIIKKDDLLLDNSIVFAKKEFSLMEARLFYNLLTKLTYKVRNENDLSGIIEMPTIEMKKMIMKDKTNISFVNYHKIVKGLKNFITVYYNQKEEKFKEISILEMFESNRNTTKLTFSKTLMEYMKLPQNQFSVLDMFEICSLNRENSIKAYEICCTYKNQKSYLMKIEDFYNYFSIKESYIKARKINKLIIEPVINDLKTYTKFDLDIVKIKENNESTHYLFNISVNKERMLTIAEKAKPTLSNDELTEVNQIIESEKVQDKQDKKEDNVFHQTTIKFIDYILSNDMGRQITSKLHNTWMDDIRKLVEVDGRTIEQIEKVIDWLYTSDYWGGVITSASIFRNRFNMLIAQSGINKNKKVKIDIPKKIQLPKLSINIPHDMEKEEYMQTDEFERLYGDQYREILRIKEHNNKIDNMKNTDTRQPQMAGDYLRSIGVIK